MQKHAIIVIELLFTSAEVFSHKLNLFKEFYRILEYILKIFLIMIFRTYKNIVIFSIISFHYLVL